MRSISDDSRFARWLPVPMRQSIPTAVLAARILGKNTLFFGFFTHILCLILVLAIYVTAAYAKIDKDFPSAAKQDR